MRAGTFKIKPINMPTLISIQKRLNIIGDVLNIYYYNSKGYKLTIVNDTHIIYKKSDLKKNGRWHIKEEVKEAPAEKPGLYRKRLPR